MFDNTGARVGDIVLFMIEVVLEVTKLVGELDCEDDSVELVDVL